MLDSLILNKQSIESIYRTLYEYHKKHLKRVGVKLPKLYGTKGNFTKDALVLVYLAYDYPKTRVVSKEELTKFIRSFYPTTNDVQQARHLGAQSGWWIIAGGRDNIVDDIKRGFYHLHSLEQPYPGFKRGAGYQKQTAGKRLRKNTTIVVQLAVPKKASPISTGPARKQL